MKLPLGRIGAGKDRRRPSRIYLESLESRTLFSLSIHLPLRTWTINGDGDRAHPNDSISIVYNAQSKKLDLTINGVLRESRDPATLRAIVINAGKGDDTVTVDTAYPTHKTVPVTVRGGEGNDTLTGGDEVDTFVGGNGDDTLNGARGNDHLDGGNGNDILDGGEGDDVLIGGNGDDSLSGDEENDKLNAGNGNNTLNGGDGNDLLISGSGNDSLNGGAGNDNLTAGNGDDTLIGGEGNDKLNGGNGHDTLYAQSGQDQTVGAGADHVINLAQPLLVDTSPPGPGEGDIASIPTVPYTGPLRQPLIDQAVETYRPLFGLTFINRPPAATPASTIHINLPQPPAPAVIPFAINALDPLQTDGSFVFSLQNNLLVITDVRDVGHPQVVAQITTDPGTPYQFYIAGNRLIVLTSQQAPVAAHFPMPTQVALPLLPIGTAANSQSYTAVATYDITDRIHPVLVEHSTYSGKAAFSSMAGDQLYLILGNSVQLPAPQTVPTGNVTAPDENGLSYPEYRYQTESEFRQWLDDHLDAYLPAVTTTLANGSAGPARSLLDNIQYSSYGPDPLILDGKSYPATSPHFPAFTTLVDIDVADATAGPADLVTAEGSTPQVVTGTDQNLYAYTLSPVRNFFSNVFPYFDRNFPYQASHILKFDLGFHAVDFDSAGHVDGILPNANAFNLYNGQLRLVTYGADGTKLSIFDDSAGPLALLGSVSLPQFNSELGMPVRSVFFTADRAFIETKSFISNPSLATPDQLFTFDLSDPGNLVLSDSLPILPGTFAYLPVDDHHLVVTTNGFLSLQFAVIDASDAANPAILQQTTEGTYASSGYSAQLLPLSGNPGASVLVLPYSDFAIPTFIQHLALYEVAPDRSFMHLATLPTPSPIIDIIALGPDIGLLYAHRLTILDPLAPLSPVAEIPLS